MPPIGWYVLVLVAAGAVTAAVTWPARALSLRVGYVDWPTDRKMHTRAVPYGGGAAMLLGFLAAMVVAASIPALSNLFVSSSEPLGVVLAGAAIFGIGLIDDVKEMSPPAKVAGQVLAASILYFLGVTMYQFKIPFAAFVVLNPGVTPLITALWVIAITNAINFIDGLDGLAAGVVAIAGGAIAVYGLRLMELGTLPADNIGPLIACIACGVCLGFLPFNFPPAKIFMGDAGALFLGLLMSACTMVIGGTDPAHERRDLLLLRPPADPPPDPRGAPPRHGLRLPPADRPAQTLYHPDKDHIHHRLIRLGHGPRRSVVILWAWTALLSGFVLFPLFFHQVNAIIPFGAAALAIALYTFFHPGIRQQEAEADEAGETTTRARRGQDDGGRPAGGNGRGGRRGGSPGHGRSGHPRGETATGADHGMQPGNPPFCRRASAGAMMSAVLMAPATRTWRGAAVVA